MKFSLISAAVLAATSGVSAFTTKSITTTPSSVMKTTTTSSVVVAPTTYSTFSTELFGLADRKAVKADYDTLTTEDEVRGLFKLWNDALSTGDSRIVAARYARDAVLLPTVSDTPRTDYDSIKAYFDVFLTKKPQGEIVQSFVKIGDNWAQDNGM
jgi:hypothetical protein